MLLYAHYGDILAEQGTDWYAEQKLSQSLLAKFEADSGRVVQRDKKGLCLPRLVLEASFVKESEDHIRFATACRENRIITAGEGMITRVYSQDDYDSADKLVPQLPNPSVDPVRGSFRGTCLYHGNPPVFAGRQFLRTSWKERDFAKSGSVLHFHSDKIPVNGASLTRRPLVKCFRNHSIFIRDDLRCVWDQAGVTGVAYWDCEERGPSAVIKHDGIDGEPEHTVKRGSRKSSPPRIWGLVVADGVSEKVDSNNRGKNPEKPLITFRRAEVDRMGSIFGFAATAGRGMGFFMKGDAYRATRHLEDIEWIPVEVVD